MRLAKRFIAIGGLNMTIISVWWDGLGASSYAVMEMRNTPQLLSAWQGNENSVNACNAAITEFSVERILVADCPPDVTTNPYFQRLEPRNLLMRRRRQSRAEARILLEEHRIDLDRFPAGPRLIESIRVEWDRMVMNTVAMAMAQGVEYLVKPPIQYTPDLFFSSL